MKVNTTQGVYAHAALLNIRDSYISNKDASDDGNYQEAGIYLRDGRLEVKNTVVYDSQRGVLAYDHHLPDAPKSNVLLKNVHAVGFTDVRGLNNRHEAFLIHARGANSSGYDRVTIRDCGTNRTEGSSLTVWKPEINNLSITGFTGPDIIDIAVAKPIHKLFIRDISVTRVLIRIMDGFEIDMIGDWSLDNAYKYTLVDARGGTGQTWTDDVVGEFDSPQDIRDWWQESKRDA